jgi:hypothetical protein
VNSLEKERSSTLISMSESGMLGVEDARGRGYMHTQPCAPAAARTRTAQSQAAHFERAWPADGSCRRSATRPPTTHDSAPACGLAVLPHRRKP